MAIFESDSLQLLKDRIDLKEALSPFVELKRFGSTYKGLCPFHDEKTASFVVNDGDSYYHCFGCGAHGDAIQFYIAHQKLSFVQAVELLAEKFGVQLEKKSADEKKGPSRIQLKQALALATDFFHFCLLHTSEGELAQKYLQKRSIDKNFIEQFHLGLALVDEKPFLKFMREQKISYEVLLAAGLVKLVNETRYRAFFQSRILFPIHHPVSGVIGFSGRNYLENSYGGKYINTPETTLFKKSQVLFGLNFCKAKIIQTGQVVLVEGQLDALRLIEAGLNVSLASQGTAFGEAHVKELVQLGLKKAYIAFDGDSAGIEAAFKVGNLLQKQGIEAMVVKLPAGSDPDQFVQTNGIDNFLKLIQSAQDYLSFLVEFQSRGKNLNSPTEKNEVVSQIVKLIRTWESSLIVHESLKKLAHTMQIPEAVLGVDALFTSNTYVKTFGFIGNDKIDSINTLEVDLLRWLYMFGFTDQQIFKTIQLNI